MWRRHLSCWTHYEINGFWMDSWHLADLLPCENRRTRAKAMRDLFCHLIQSCKLGVLYLFVTHGQINRTDTQYQKGPCPLLAGFSLSTVVKLWAHKLHEESLYLHFLWKEPALTLLKQMRLDIKFLDPLTCHHLFESWIPTLKFRSDKWCRIFSAGMGSKVLAQRS